MKDRLAGSATSPWVRLPMIKSFESDQTPLLLQPGAVKASPTRESHLDKQTRRGAEGFFKLSTQTGTRADVTMAKALHKCSQRSHPTSWRCGRHIQRTWYCFRFGGEEVAGGTRKIQPSLSENKETTNEIQEGPFEKSLADSVP